MEKEDKYFLIDICGTLYQSNTTFDFIRYFFSEKPWYIRLNGLRKNKLFRFCNTKVYLANLHTSFLCNLIYPTFSRILLYSC